MIGDASVVKLDSTGQEVWITDQLEGTKINDIEVEDYPPFDDFFDEGINQSQVG